MRIGTYFLLFFATALVICNVQIVFGNGRPVPQTREAVPVKAVCNQTAGEKIEIFRVRFVAGNDPMETIKVTGGSVMEELSLREIKRLKFLTTESTTDGFMKAEVSRFDSSEKISSMVQIRSNDTAIRLVGFSNSGTPVSIELSKCQDVDFLAIGKAWTPSTNQRVFSY